jgi:outer membrane biosynthesis protein TonB
MPALAVMALLSSLGPSQAAQPVEGPGPPCEWSTRWQQLRIPPFGPEARLVGPERRKGRIRMPRPKQRHEIEGRLTVQVAIDAKGRTVDARIIERPFVIPPWPELEGSVIEDARKLKWKPATADGVPVPVCMDLPVFASPPRLVE